jgi:hypothetical protein
LVAIVDAPLIAVVALRAVRRRWAISNPLRLTFGPPPFVRVTPLISLARLAS